VVSAPDTRLLVGPRPVGGVPLDPGGLLSPQEAHLPRYLSLGRVPCITWLHCWTRLCTRTAVPKTAAIEPINTLHTIKFHDWLTFWDDTVDQVPTIPPAYVFNFYFWSVNFDRCFAILVWINTKRNITYMILISIFCNICDNYDVSCVATLLAFTVHRSILVCVFWKCFFVVCFVHIDFAVEHFFAYYRVLLSQCNARITLHEHVGLCLE